MESQEWFFIEMNPRVQVEHTVTEVITGLDIVRSQILIAQGESLHGPVVNLPPQDQVARHGFAIQCRITTEDPEKNFSPDYGKIINYRSAAGFGIRLDGAMGDTGAVITPFYDSLLVKLTASDATFQGAIHRMNRALRELDAQAWISGLRRSQSSTRGHLRPLERQNKTYKAYPIIDWNDRDIYRYLTENNLPYHPLWDQGYVSVGDWHSTSKLEAGMNAEDTRFNGRKRECGLHELSDRGGDYQI